MLLMSYTNLEPYSDGYIIGCLAQFTTSYSLQQDFIG